ncbi:MAG: UDP-N-acetylglucosamine--N-acetylmuramyl-(pentapeptide) pyrophosphoryl-undecaprenol N-acetylglucosamine transferase, partial [Planctomycetes bacterium]|nr:UDP-N-acetylglucosamine--N-acetylmuramyl-(pentapeptide) pyrophosphoryl-undecaprenol N-acetylglucosamine transferase [Planctomycetota bacterium]
IVLAFPILDPERLPERRAVVEGNPLREDFDADTTPGAEAFGLEPGRPTVVSLGGSQGARGVNRMVLGMRAELGRRSPGVQLLMLTGDVDHAAVQEEIARSPEPKTVAVPFESRMNDVYRIADVVVARAGATTLSEVARIGKPLALVPYPYGDGHQFDNARLFERAGGAAVVEEGDGASVRLLHVVARLLADPAARAAAAEQSRALHRPHAATQCANVLLDIASRSAR